MLQNIIYLFLHLLNKATEELSDLRLKNLNLAVDLYL